MELLPDVTAPELRFVAGAFRSTVESIAPFDHFYAALRSFPRGCCKDASFLLARTLDQKYGVTAIQYVWGQRHPEPFDWRTHGWLQVGSLIVDVTADQFPEVDSPVVVVDAAESPFHDSWMDLSRSPYPRFWSLHEEAAPHFEMSAQAIIARMPEWPKTAGRAP